MATITDDAPQSPPPESHHHYDDPIHHDEDFWTRRFLAGGGDGLVKIDYNVLSVATMTLALIMMVEVIRHKLDHMAHDRPFFHTVLENIYAELATLGIVEFVLHLIGEYHTSYSGDRQQVFADVHFLLFYTAILNALQSVLTAVVTTRRSRRLWLETEMLEIHHYVEVREEFERAEQELLRKHARSSSTAQQKQQQLSPDDSTVPFSAWDRPSWRHVWLDPIRYPRLLSKYNRLLAQVRFHDLRLHFLESYNLPKKLRISDYLIRSENDLLLQLVRVSTASWLLLTAAACLMYYVLGMVFYKLQNETLVGTALIWIFFCSVIAFVIISWLVSHKMKIIFHSILHNPRLWRFPNNTDPAETAPSRDPLIAEQLALFWGGEPKYVIIAIKSMQFGYAVALSTLIIYYEEINDGDVRMQWYLITIFVCFALFVHVTGNAIPRFVLCTNLGQLMDERRLREVVALFRLDEAKQKQLELLAEGLVVASENNNYYMYGEDVLVQTDDPNYLTASNSNGNAAPTHAATASLAQAVAKTPAQTDRKQQCLLPLDTALAAAPNLVTDLMNGQDINDPRYSQLPTISTACEGVPTVPEEGTFHDDTVNDPLALSKAASAFRRSRRKTVSDGVATMASLRYLPALKEMEVPAPETNIQDDFALGQARFNSGGVPIVGRFEESTDVDTASQRRERRSRRQKSVSDGVAMMAQLRQAEAGTEFSGNRAEKPLPGGRHHHPQKGPRRVSRKVDEGDLLAKLVRLDTEALRTSLEVLDPAGTIKPPRRNRRKVVSEGVGTMASIGGHMSAAAGKALSGGKRATLVTQDDLSMPWRTPSTGSAAPIAMVLGASNDASSRYRDRSARQKSLSDGVASMVSLSIGQFQSWSADNRSMPITFDTTETHERIVESNEYFPDHLNDSKGHPLANGSKKEDNDASSIHSTSSTLGGYSDVEDVPATGPSLSTRNIQESLPMPSLRERLQSYFRSKQYLVVSDVFGTLVIFFLVGHRVEAFIHSEGIISEKFVSLYVQLSTVFWFETTWFILFLVMSVLIFYSIGHVDKSKRTTKDYNLLFAAAIDVVLVAVCLVVFFAAETDRCCHPAESEARRLAENREPAPCGCPAFGSRSYSGLGKIEPYTSLILLRVFRHMLSKRLTHRMVPKKCNTAQSNGSVHGEIDAIPHVGLEVDFRTGETHTIHDKELVSVVAQVWESTIGKYPELAKMHGEFSGQILRAMLGVGLMEHAPVKPNYNDSEMGTTEVHGEATQARRDALTSSKSFCLNKGYSGLSTEAQAIILAGKLGCSLVESQNRRDLRTVNEVSESRLEVESEFPASSHPGMSRGQSTLFQIDLREDSASDFYSMLVSPNARLVRNMRRCHRKLLPILDKWTVVDVAMTRFEMVYFDAVGVDEASASREFEATRQAIIATKGGKGLRLCDVATGRRIVGHLLLSDIASVHVERKMPVEGAIVIGDDPDSKVEKTEFWKTTSHQQAGISKVDQLTVGNEWNTMKQDHVRIHTQHGHKLYLRFLADLEHGRHHHDVLSAEDEIHGELNKNNALQWAQTIIRFCGPAQLRQPLPHFGDDTPEELRDFLIVVNGGDENKLRRRNSAENLFRMSSRKKMSHRRVKSQAGDSDCSPEKKTEGNASNDAVFGNASHSVALSQGQEPLTMPSGKSLLSRRVSFSEFP